MKPGTGPEKWAYKSANCKAKPKIDWMEQHTRINPCHWLIKCSRDLIFIYIVNNHKNRFIIFLFFFSSFSILYFFAQTFVTQECKATQFIGAAFRIQSNALF